jgi:Tol biopolymer transport system component/DNA-binding winged helix-turn-helix (wHTH) protein
MMASKSFIFRFDDVEVHEREFKLVKAGGALAVEPKAFRVLLILLRNPGKLIGKEDLLNAVWGDAAVTDNSLARSVALLRRLLCDEARDPRYIETVATVGYRFIGKVEVTEDTAESLKTGTWRNGSTARESGTDATDRLGEESGAPTAQADEEPGEKSGTGGPRRKGRIRMMGWLVAGCVLLAGSGAATWQLHRPLPPPHISAYTQITHDGRLKDLAGTDGSRLYFTWSSPQTIAQVGVTGGESATIPVAVPGTMCGLMNVSPDGSRFLVGSVQENSPSFSLWEVPVLGGSSRRLPDAWDAAFSPDGVTVAYSTLEGEIWLVGSDGKGAHKLASIGGSASSLSWSPDGGRIEFASDLLLREIASNGSNLHQMLPGWNTPGWQCCGSWTPDGRLFLFLLGGSILAGGNQIWALDERRGLLRQPPAEPIQLTTGPIQWSNPIAAKDGKKIFATGTTPRGELTRYDAHRKQFQPFLKGISAEDLAFSKDGGSVAYVSYPEGILWKANRDGSNPVQLSDSSMYAMNPRWSPDGTQIAFMAVGPWRRDSIYIVPADGGSPRRLISNADGRQSDPTWSPDGKKILFASGVFEDPKNEDLRILDLASGQITIVPGSSGMESPRWSPDGRTIVAHPWSEGMKIFDMETQQWTSLVTKGNVSYWAFSADGRFIYFVNIGHDQGVFRVRVKGGKPERVIDLKDWHMTGYFGYWMALDPTDAPLLLRDTGTSDIYALTLEEK